MRTLVSQMKSSHVENHPTECLVLVKGEILNLFFLAYWSIPLVPSIQKWLQIGQSKRKIQFITTVNFQSFFFFQMWFQQVKVLDVTGSGLRGIKIDVNVLETSISYISQITAVVYVQVHDNDTRPVGYARNLGVWFNEKMSMSHIAKACSSVFFHLHNIRSPEKYLSVDSLQTIILNMPLILLPLNLTIIIDQNMCKSPNYSMSKMPLLD